MGRHLGVQPRMDAKALVQEGMVETSRQVGCPYRCMGSWLKSGRQVGRPYRCMGYWLETVRQAPARSGAWGCG